MSTITETRKMRVYFGKKRGKIFDPLPMRTVMCKVCGTGMQVADGSEAHYHKCCRKFRNKRIEGIIHAKEVHGVK